MKKNITCYDVLDVEKGASTEEIKIAYIQKAKEIHPDIKGNSYTANKKMALLNKAHETLIDPISRKHYDFRIEEASFRDSEKKERKGYSTVTHNDKKAYAAETENNSEVKRRQPRGSWWTVIVIVSIIFGYQIFLQMNNNSNHTTPPTQASPITEDSAVANKSFKYPTVTPEPTIDCTGPDGKHLYITKKACDDFNNAWRSTENLPQNNKSIGANSCGINSHLSSGFCVCDSGYKRTHNTGLCEKPAP